MVFFSFFFFFSSSRTVYVCVCAVIVRLRIPTLSKERTRSVHENVVVAYICTYYVCKFTRFASVLISTVIILRYEVRSTNIHTWNHVLRIMLFSELKLDIGWTNIRKWVNPTMCWIRVRCLFDENNRLNCWSFSAVSMTLFIFLYVFYRVISLNFDPKSRITHNTCFGCPGCWKFHPTAF